MKLFFIDYLIIGFYSFYLISYFIKSIKSKFHICDKHNIYLCVECTD